MIQIDNNIPLPTPNRRKSIAAPYSELDVGQSFFLPGKKSGSSAIDYWRKKLSGREFTSRMVTENGVKGMRVWRTA